MYKKVEIIKPTVPLGYAYSDPQQVSLPYALAKELIELGYAIELEDEQASDFPEDFPGRRILEKNGFTSMAELQRIATQEELEEIDGIGPKLATAILNVLKPGELTENVKTENDKPASNQNKK